MKSLDFSHIQPTAPTTSGPTARNAKEALINDIVDQCHLKTERERSTLRRRLALAANTAGWSTTDLHALLKKRQDPTIRNYTALVHSMCKVRVKRE